MTPSTIRDGYAWVIVNTVNLAKRSYAEDDETAAEAMKFLPENFELRIIGVDTP